MEDRELMVSIVQANLSYRKCWQSCDVAPEGCRPELGLYTQLCEHFLCGTRNAQVTTNLLFLLRYYIRTVHFYSCSIIPVSYSVFEHVHVLGVTNVKNLSTIFVPIF